MKKQLKEGDWIFVKIPHASTKKAVKVRFLRKQGDMLEVSWWTQLCFVPEENHLDHILDFEQLEVTEVNIYHEDVRSPVLPLANEYEFNAARIKIKESNARGYYVEVDGERHPINPDGTITPWPPALFPMLEEQLDKLTTLL